MTQPADDLEAELVRIAGELAETLEAKDQLYARRDELFLRLADDGRFPTHMARLANMTPQAVRNALFRIRQERGVAVNR